MDLALVRELRRTMEDAELLAECVNAWNDDDSWPGGFTGGIKLTGEIVYEQWIEKNSVYKQYVLEYKGKIAGYVSLDFSPSGEDVMYVPLLGVAPKYQKKGFGKRLLLKTIEETVRLRKLRLDLHTWAGNLRAMPLYKRTGFVWYPETSVHMMNFIPGILNQEFFADLIEENWYDAFQPEITQAPDKLEFEGIEGFIYRFSTNEGMLRVFVDAHAQKICGYEIIKGDEEVIEKLLVKTTPHRVYNGFLIPKSAIHIENRGKKPLVVKTNIIGRNGVTEFQGLEHRFIVASGSKEQLEWNWEPTAQPMVPYEEKPSFRTWSRFDVNAKINGKQVSFGTGARILRGIRLKPYPTYFAKAGKKGVAGEIELRNLTNVVLYGQLSLLINDKEVVPYRRCKIGSYERMRISYSVSPSDIRGKVTKLEIRFKQRGNKATISEKTVIGTPEGREPIAYIIPFEGYVLENALVRVVGRTYEYPEIEEFLVKNTGIRHTSVFFAMVGLPWNYDNSEFYEEPEEVHIRLGEHMATILLKKTSRKEKPGLRLETEFVLSTDSDLLEANFKLTNTSDEELRKIAMMTGVFSRARNSQNRAYYPNSHRLMASSDTRFYSFAGRDELKQLKQGWISVCTPEGEGRGLVSDESVWIRGDVTPRGFVILESREINISAKDVFEFPPVFFIPVGANPHRLISLWQSIKAEERERFAEPADPEQFDEAIAIGVKSDLLEDRLPVILHNETTIQLSNNTALQLTNFEVHDGQQWKKVTIDPFSTVGIRYFQELKEGGLMKAIVRTRWQAVLRVHKIPYFYLKPSEITGKWRQLEREGVSCFEFKNGFWELRSSVRGMTLYSIETSWGEWLNSCFPDIRPFSYFDHFVGGISASIRSHTDSKYGKFLLNFSEAKLSSIQKWDVIEYLGNIREPRDLYGLNYKILYKSHHFLPILMIDVEVKNPFDVPVEVEIPLILSFNPELVMSFEENEKDFSTELTASSSGSLLVLPSKTMIQLRSANYEKISIMQTQKGGKIMVSTISSDSLFAFFQKKGIIQPRETIRIGIALIKH